MAIANQVVKFIIIHPFLCKIMQENILSTNDDKATIIVALKFYLKYFTAALNICIS